MVTYIIFIFLVSFNFKVANAITNGHPVAGQKRYMVYLLQSSTAPEQYSGWMCGGAIIHHLYILTSASCIYVGKRIYVISGYNKYVSAKEMFQDVCIMEKRRKIIYFCAPNKFDIDYLYSYKDYWNHGDIAVAKVDVPFDFNDDTYKDICSYPPAPIRVNYMEKFIEGGREVISLGWGHREYYRPDGYLVDLNEDYLRYSAGRITPRTECRYTYDFDGKFSIYKTNLRIFFICVDRPGHLDEYGRREDKYDRNNIYVKCDGKSVERTGKSSNISEMECLKRAALRQGITDINATTGGFCQNDHGGPLVTWIGGIETLIGVASTAPVDKEMRCRTPYLYTSTVCVNQIIECHLKEGTIGGSRRDMRCEKLMENGTDIRQVWLDESGKKETSQDQKDTSQDQKDTSQDQKDTSQDQKDTSQDQKDTSQDQKDTSQDQTDLSSEKK